MKRLLSSRKYKSGVGTRYCVFRWSDAQEPYLTRLFLIKTPWFSLCVNWIKQPDKGDPHDHTSAFLSIPIWGSYVEHRIIVGCMDKMVLRWFLNWNYMRGCDWDRHRIVSVSNGGMISLCIMGPKVREWYYHTPTGPVHWTEYEENTGI